jgi:hypothetical protein
VAKGQVSELADEVSIIHAHAPNQRHGSKIEFICKSNLQILFC